MATIGSKEEPSVQANSPGQVPLPEIPRAIFIALDPMGKQVLQSLLNRLRELPEYKRALTVLLHYCSGQGFQYLFSGLTERETQPQARTKKEEAAVAEQTEMASLICVLQAAREQLCSQSRQAELQYQGLRIGGNLEVYIVTALQTLQQLQLMETVTRTVTTSLSCFELVRTTGVISLTELETQNARTGDLNKIQDGLNSLLTEPNPANTNEAGQRLMARCYILTHETLGGRSVLSEGEQVERIAGFLAIHYLDSLRQPMTSQQYLLFGSAEGGNPEIAQDCGLCDIFGYADLKFQIRHILDWCAVENAGRVLQERFLQLNDQGSTVSLSHNHLQQLLTSAGATLSLEQIATEVTSTTFQSMTAESETAGSSTLAGNSLAHWRSQRVAIDESLRQMEKDVEAKAGQLYQHLETVLRDEIDRLISSDTQGLTKAEELLSTIEATCRTEIDRFGQEENDLAQDDVDPTREINQSWIRLARAATAIPSAITFGGRTLLVAIVGLLGALVSGWEGISLIGAAALGVVAWSIYTWLWLPRRLRLAEKEFQRTLARWQFSHLHALVRQQIKQLLLDLMARFAVPTSSRQAGEEWYALQEWRKRLTQASAICTEFVEGLNKVAQASDEFSSSNNRGITIRNHELIIGSQDLRKYYEQLTTWSSQEAANVFLRRLAGTKGDQWRTSTSRQIADGLRQVCHKLYEERVTLDITELEHHLLEISGLEKAQVETLLDVLLQVGAPMARIRRLHGHWRLPRQSLLLVHNPNQTAFAEYAAQRSVEVIGGALANQINFVHTIHQVPVQDLQIISQQQESSSTNRKRKHDRDI